MKMPQAFLVCLSLLGATQFVGSQVKQSTVPAIPGYLDPTTGKFSARVISSANAQENAQATPAAANTGTNVFFREDFQITIQNYDQPANSTVVCSVSIYGSDANYGYGDSAAVNATATGSGWTCDVPILTLWTLKTPSSDTISASISITIVPPGATASTYTGGAFRSSQQSLPSLPQPSNGQTAVNTLTFQL